MNKRKPKQLILQSQSWGGRRRGAGRPKKKNAGVSHARRPAFRAKTPIHVTVRVREGVPTLRSATGFRTFMSAVKGAKIQGLRILQFAVLGNHFHLLVEARDQRELTRGMKSLNIRLAKRFNVGAFVKDRFHAEILKTPRQFRNALVYVFANAAKHFRREFVFDKFSSFAIFKDVKKIASMRSDLDWRPPKGDREKWAYLRELICDPESWLARTGWMIAT